MALFGLFGWLGVTLSSIWWFFPWQWGTLFSGGRFAYAFWWSVPLAVVGGYLAVYAQLKLQGRSERQEAEQAAAANAKTPEEEAIERAEYLAARRAGFTGLEIGTSTGELLERRGHKGGLPNGTPVVLSPEDCAKNIIVLRGTNSNGWIGDGGKFA